MMLLLSSKELNVGAKDVRIFIGGELVWEGVIDKVHAVSTLFLFLLYICIVAE